MGDLTSKNKIEGRNHKINPKYIYILNNSGEKFEIDRYSMSARHRRSNDSNDLLHQAKYLDEI